MSDWSGEGLPPAAQARMERARTGGPWSSLLGVNGQTGLEGCGFSVVGEAMGCIVEHIGWDGFGGCGYYGYGYGGGPGGGGGFGNSPFGGNGPFGGGGSYAPSTVTSGQASGYAGFAPYAEAMYAGYDTAILRMLGECQALGADGVVGVELSVKHLGNDNREFLAYGTAVRAHSAARPRNIFSTTLSGQDVAKLLHGGWVPAGIIVGLSIAVRHDDWATIQQATMFAGNQEVSGYSELVHHVRADARHQFERRAAAYGADGAILSTMGLDVWEREAGESHRDHVALGQMSGTAVARFHTGERAPTRSLGVLPLAPIRRAT